MSKSAFPPGTSRRGGAVGTVTWFQFKTFNRQPAVTYTGIHRFQISVVDVYFTTEVSCSTLSVQNNDIIQTLYWSAGYEERDNTITASQMIIECAFIHFCHIELCTVDPKLIQFPVSHWVVRLSLEFQRFSDKFGDTCQFGRVLRLWICRLLSGLYSYLFLRSQYFKHIQCLQIFPKERDWRYMLHRLKFSGQRITIKRSPQHSVSLIAVNIVSWRHLENFV